MTSVSNFYGEAKVRKTIDALAAREGLPPVDFMTKEENKKAREEWILRHFADSYNRSHLPLIEYVESAEAPDFMVFSCAVDEGQPIEIAELLEPGRKRDAQYKSKITIRENPAPEADYEDRLVTHASKLLSRKLSKAYPRGTWLIVYFNPDKGIFQDDLLSFAVRVMSRALEPLAAPAAISQIWILTNGGDVERIYPKERTE